MVNEAYGDLGARILLWPDIMDTRLDSDDDDDMSEYLDPKMPPSMDARPDDPVMTHAIWLARFRQERNLHRADITCPEGHYTQILITK